MNILPRFSIDRPRWLLIVGPDLANSDWGITLRRGPRPPMGEWKQWRINWRVNIRWPIEIRRRVHGRARLRHYCVVTHVGDPWGQSRLFWTEKGALRWRQTLGEQARAFKWDGEIWARLR